MTAGGSLRAVSDVAISGSTLTLTLAASAAAGEEVTVSYTPGTSPIRSATGRDAADLIRVAVTTVEVNRPPMPAGTLSALSLRVADGAVSVDVSGAFENPDGDGLTYEASSSNESVATATASGSTVTVTPVSGGTSTVTVTATDEGGLSATQTFVATVANRSPEAVGTLSTLSLRVPGGAETVEVSVAFRDPDGDDLTYGASSSAVAVATATASGSTVSVTPVSGGTATVTVTATDADGSNTSAIQRFEVTVANRSPEAVGSLAALTRRVADGAATVAVAAAFRDPDGDTLTYGAESSATAVARASASGTAVTVTPVSDGTATVTVTATDRSGSNTSAEQRFEVTVPENAGPERVGTLENKALDLQGGALTVDVSGAFRDPDRDTLTYGAESSNPSAVTVSMSGSRVTLTQVDLGTAEVTVTATDRGGSNTSATQTFDVTVGGNRSPEPVGTLRALSLRVEDGDETVEVANAFRDRDNDDLTYGASSSDERVALAAAAGSTVTVTPAASGTATVTVTARDADGSNTTARQRFAVTVANRSPEAVGTLTPLALRTADGAVAVDVSGAFADPDDDALTYGASSSPVTVAAAVTLGSMVTVTPLSQGAATVTVRPPTWTARTRRRCRRSR